MRNQQDDPRQIGGSYKFHVGQCCCSVTHLCPTLGNPVDCNMLGFPVLHYFPELAQTHVHWAGAAIQPSHPLSSPSPLPSLFPSIKVFSTESALCIRRPKYWSFCFSTSPSKVYSGLISFRVDWFDLLAAQWALKSLLQHCNSKHQFFNAQPPLLSNYHICTWLLQKP